MLHSHYLLLQFIHHCGTSLLLFGRTFFSWRQYISFFTTSVDLCLGGEIEIIFKLLISMDSTFLKASKCVFCQYMTQLQLNGSSLRHLLPKLYFLFLWFFYENLNIWNKYTLKGIKQDINRMIVFWYVSPNISFISQKVLKITKIIF